MAQATPNETPPDESWNTFPADKAAPTPAPVPDTTPEPPPPTPRPADVVPVQPSGELYRPGAVRIEPNTISMFGARSLGHLVRGEMLYLGFPMLGARFAMGLGDRLDIGVGYEGFWFMMNAVVLGARVTVVRGQNWALAGLIDGTAAFFTTKPSVDIRGARWLTGRRNFNLMPGLVVSYQGDHPRAARLFVEARYLLSFDTEPYQRIPLGGVPAAVQLGHNALVRAGAEMPLSAKTSFIFLLGLDVHGRADDSPVMPVCSVGLVTSF